MPTYPKHLYWLDSFRFIAALIVVISHTRNTVFVEYGSLPDSEKSPLIALGYAATRISNEAVVMFFVLSGFLVGGSAARKIIDKTFVLSDYAIDRFSRIMVPLIPALGFTAFVLLVRGEGIDLGELLGNLISLQGVLVEPFGGNESLWSLSYEVWFYILIFVVGASVRKANVGVSTLLSIACVFVIFCYLLPSYLFCWLVGTIVYFMQPPKFYKSTLCFALALMALGVVAIQLSSGFSLGESAFFALLPSIEVSRIILSMGMALFVRQIILVKPKGFILMQFDRVGSKLAKSSYTLYLTHFPLIHLFSVLGLEQASEINSSTLLVFIGVLTACVIFSGLFYYLFERHTITVRSFLKARYESYSQLVYFTFKMILAKRVIGKLQCPIRQK